MTDEVRGAPGQRPVAPLGPALVVGLLAGNIEIAVLGFRRFALHQLNFIPQYYWWLGPLVTAAIIVVVSLGVTVALPNRWRGTAVARIAVPSTLLIVTVLAQLFGNRLHFLALWAVAAGLAIQLSRWLTRGSVDWSRLARRAIPVLLMAPMVCGLFLLIESRRRSALPGTGVPATPNVLLLILDTVRASDLGIYGGQEPETSIALGKLAHRGVVFENAFSTTSWSAPSHGSVFTGRWAHELTVDWKKWLDRGQPTLAEVFSARGYATAGFTANTMYVSRETGLARGFQHYEDYRFRLGGLFVTSALGSHLATVIGNRIPAFRRDPLDDRIWADEITARFLTWLDGRGSTPFFAFVNLFDAHAPYFPSDSFWRKFVRPDRRRPLVVGPEQRSAKAAEIRHRAYIASIAEQDGKIDRLLAALESRGLLDHTIVVVTSDHGEEFLEHGVLGHGQSLYFQSLHVPLVIRAPAGLLPEGKRVSTPVSNRQVAATLGELIDLPDQTFAGRSLLADWRGTADGAERPIYFRVSPVAYLPNDYPVTHGPLRSVFFRAHQFIDNAEGKEELYDLRSDPEERVNLVGRPESASVASELRDSLNRYVPR